MGKPRKTQSDGLGVSQDKPHNLTICCLVLPQPVSLLPQPCLPHILAASARLASLKVLTVSASPRKNASTTSLVCFSARYLKILLQLW